MNVSVCIATYGSEDWAELAWSRAYPSAIGQSDDVVVYHGSSLAQARNHAAEQAKGEWVLWLDADDELCPCYVEEMERAADDAFECPPIFAPAMQHLGQRAPAIPNLGRWPDANEVCIGAMYDRDFFLRTLDGFRELPSLEDFDLALRAVKAGARIVHVPAAVYCAYTRPGSRNSDQSIYAQLREEHAEVWTRGTVGA